MKNILSTQYNGIYIQSKSSDKEIQEQVKLIEERFNNTAVISKKLYLESSQEMIDEFFR
ncbi:MAG: hypothetical protein ACP6IY_06170 [Promethearchaeia archaeon]